MSFTSADLRRHLALRGPQRSSALQRRFEVAQATMSRRLDELGGDVVRIGKARNTRWALRRDVPGVADPIRIFEIQPDGQPVERCHLRALAPDGVWVEGPDAGQSFLADDLPWFLDDLRPGGFLGRLIPRRHHELRLPADIRVWGADDVLRWAAAVGWSLPGAFVVGEAALQHVVHGVRAEPITDVEGTYVEAARDVLAFGPVGSSADGEQPKFLVDRAGRGPCLVKFSPPTDSLLGRRVADLLIAEWHALEAIRAVHPAARADLVEAGGRWFFEVRRFDRIGRCGRRGMVSLATLDSEFVGSTRRSWSETTAALLDQGRISAGDHRATLWLEQLGLWIANTDMHLGNLAFHLEGLQITGLTPAYDVSPMAYAPRHHELPPVRFEPEPADSLHAAVAESALDAAIGFWEACAADSRISDGFRRVARDNSRGLQLL